AEDVVQEVFARLWSRKVSLENINNIKAFAFKMTRNLCLDKIKLRKQKVGKTEKSMLLVSDFNPHELAEIKDMISIVQKIISFLPEQQRLVIQLKSIEELSFEEIEEITDMSVNSIRVNLSRARKTINEIYQKHFIS
ncbi:MAG TPA: sigma-70 family RNA polymerase sigma factor, partial [Cyclobacteriaceae bacterium]|nr:sigma-70 family RNA polymerase sigma factor [Cyclobacteriaceae bacterium]